MQNIAQWDRWLRALVGLLALEAAYFWLGSSWQMVVGAVGVVLLLTALFRFCPLYRLLGLSTAKASAATAVPASGARKWLAGLALLIVAVGGAYASDFFSRKFYIEDFNVMNNFYKQTLFLTGKNEREKAIANYEGLVPAFQKFLTKYTRYQPHALKYDAQFGSDLVNVGNMLTQVEPLVRTGDLHQAHLDLEKVRPVFQEIFKRNGFSMVAVTLVDFHDAMELVLDAATAKDPAKVMALYPQVSDKLKAVEEVANDSEIQLIRKNLDEVLDLAKSGSVDALPAKGEALKSSFVKVYLQRG